MIWWSTFGLFLVIINCFYVPYLVSFAYYEPQTMLSFVINLFFLIDLLIKFRTAHYSKGLLITDHKKILRHNFNIMTAIDIISIISGSVYFFRHSTEFLKYGTFFTLIRMYKTTTYINCLEDHF